ncbi:unnamed protein product [Alternaria alternata]
MSLSSHSDIEFSLTRNVTFRTLKQYSTTGHENKPWTYNGGHEAERNISLRTIQRFIDDLVGDSTQAYFCDEPCESETRRRVITDTVLLILGSWSLMSDYFTSQRGEPRGVLRAYCWNTDKDYSETLPLEESLLNLVRKSGLLPNTSETITSTQSKTSLSSRSSETNEGKSLRKREQVTLHPSLGSVESLSITAASLNAFKLAHLGAIRILWTNNLSRHLLLSNHAGKFYLELFAMPSALGSGPDQVLKNTGIPSELMDEVCQSYANLFNPKSPSLWHIYLEVLLGAQLWCWCLSCASRRLRNSELRKLKSTPFVPKGSSASRPKFDSEVKILMDDKALGWDQGEFENLWPRIIALEVHLAQCKPWSFWVIFRDRRDSVQFWTFL